MGPCQVPCADPATAKVPQGNQSIAINAQCQCARLQLRGRVSFSQGQHTGEQ
jgi:hypothetical protein